MRYKKMSAAAVAIFMGVLACGCLVVAHEEGEPMVITIPETEEPMSCAVYFADNMVYAPQWRIGNYVRIETMVLDMTGYSTAEDICTTDLDVYPTGLEQQAAILADPSILNDTRMVSVSYIEITMRDSDGHAAAIFDAGWDPVTGDLVMDGGVGREVNKAGHLIYGMLWDTSDVEDGIYTVEVRLGHVVAADGGWTAALGEWYSVDYAIANWYNPEAEEGTLMDPDHPFNDIVLESDPMYSIYKIGVGGVGDQMAWIELGPLIPQGSGGGNGGNGNGGDGGNGNGGDGGNGNGGHDRRARGK
jgi:uncharacterized membrane protein YgcG